MAAAHLTLPGSSKAPASHAGLDDGPSTPVPAGAGAAGRGTAAGGTANAPRSLALKISRLLSASLEDAGTRAALETLDEYDLVDGRGRLVAGTASSEGKTAKGRQLRAEIDKRLLDESNKFLDAFKEVNAKLTELQTHLSSMHTVVDTVQAQLASANTGTKHLLSSAATLRAERLATADKQAIVTVFIRRFTLSDQEIKAMTAREVPVGRELFDAIRKTEGIRKDCRVLMSGEASEEAKAGMEIMLQTSQYLDSAFSKIHKYTTFAARNYTTRPEVLDNVSPTLRYALQLLKVNRSDLFEDTLSVLSQTRSAAISNMFIEALTRGVDPTAPGHRGKEGMAAARPIELHAHDPIRYVGDILAWVHQAMAGEREFLESLFGMKDSGRRVGAARPALTPSSSIPTSPALEQPSDEARLRTLLDKNLEGCGRPMRIRIQQTIKSHSLISSITTYQVFQLLQFYRILMLKTMGAEAGLCKILSELCEFANRSFFETIKEQGQSLLQSVPAPAMDLKPPTAIRDAMSTLREILQVHKQSLLDPEDRSDADEFEAVLKVAIDPVMELVDRMKALKPQEMERLIFECNCVLSVQHTLEAFSEFTTQKMATLSERLRVAVDTLTTLHLNALLRESGLEPIIGALHGKKADEPLSLVPAASSRNLTNALRSFDLFLSHIDTLSSPRLSLLASHKLASDIHRDALKRVIVSYNELWDAVMDGSNKYEFSSTLMHRSQDEVAMLLGA